MKLAIISKSPDLDGPVAETFALGLWLLIVEDESGLVEKAVPRGEGGDMAWARLIVDSGCEGVLCGPIEREPFLVMADEGGVTRFNAAGLSGVEALAKAGRRELEFIRDHIGGQGHQHSHSGGGECSGKHH